MNKTVEDIVKGKEVVTEEIFEVVNCYQISNLMVQDGDRNFSMQINHFEAYGDSYEFSQETTDNSYRVKQSDILSVNAKWEEEIDCLIITCRMVDNKIMNIIIYYISNDYSYSECNGYYETYLDSIYEFLEEALGEKGKYKCASAVVEDKFSVFLKSIFPKVFIDTLDEDDWKLHISDGMGGMVLNVSVTDDSCNTFYRKDEERSVEIVIKPYGQPFMNIRLLYLVNS